MLSIQQLREFKEQENKVEFKAASNGNYSFAGGSHIDPKKRRRCILGYVCALANEKGGYLVFGMSDQYPHEVVGTNQCLGAHGKLEADIYNHLHIRVQTDELFDENRRRVFIISVPSRPVGKVIKFEDIALMRIGEELHTMSDEQYRSIIQEQEGDFSAETVVGFSLTDIDDKAFDRLKLLYARKQKNEQFLTLSKTQILKDIGLLRESQYTYAILILIGTESAIKRFLPQSTVIIEYRNSENKITFDKRLIISKPYYLMIEDLWYEINQRNGTMPVQEGPFIFDIPYFNEEVIRESLNNAIAHRDYRKQSEILIKQYSHFLQINNPGGFPDGVTLQNLLSVNSTPRNRLLADVLQKTGAVERSGQGIDKIFYQSLSEAKGEPDYSESDDYQVSLKLSAVVEDKAFALFIYQTQEERQPERKLGVKEIITLNKIRKHSKKELLDKNIIDRLLAENLIEKVGKTRSQTYILSKEYFAFTDQRGHYLKDKPYHDYQITMLIQHFFAEYESAKMGDFERILGGKMTRPQIKYFVNNLVKTNALTKYGVKNGTYYKLGDVVKDGQKFISRALQLGIEEMKKRGEYTVGANK
jgi:ATP-dependent DNA helicase RecG